MRPLIYILARHRRDMVWRTCSKISGASLIEATEIDSCYQVHFRIDGRALLKDPHGTPEKKNPEEIKQSIWEPSDETITLYPPVWKYPVQMVTYTPAVVR